MMRKTKEDEEGKGKNKKAERGTKRMEKYDCKRREKWGGGGGAKRELEEEI